MSDVVRLDQRDHVAVVILDRPKVNAINADMVAGLNAACERIESSGDIRAAVIWGGERTFSAGADLDEMAQGGGMDAARRVRALQRVLDRVESLPVVTIAAVNGYALGGGCELSMSCDLRVAAARARFGQPEIALGLIPGAGGTQRLPRLIGVGRAKTMIYTGDPIDAGTALQWGLVDEVVESGDALDRALEQASRFAEGPTESLAAAKRAIQGGLDAGISTGLELELQAFAALFQTYDTRHGIDSFREHGPGKAAFEGR